MIAKTSQGRTQWLVENLGKGADSRSRLMAVLPTREDRTALERIIGPCRWELQWTCTRREGAYRQFRSAYSEDQGRLGKDLAVQRSAVAGVAVEHDASLRLCPPNDYVWRARQDVGRKNLPLHRLPEPFCQLPQEIHPERLAGIEIRRPAIWRVSGLVDGRECFLAVRIDQDGLRKAITPIRAEMCCFRHGH